MGSATEIAETSSLISFSLSISNSLQSLISFKISLSESLIFSKLVRVDNYE